MQILLVNDDGYKAKGLHVLCEAMARIGDVTVVAPKTPQSAMSSSVSLGLKKLAGKQLPKLGPGKWYYLDATPVSCVKFALNFPFSESKPDVVISGINHGSNASTGSCYSATLGAAEEAAISGIPSIGVSLNSFHPDADFSVIVEYFPGILRTLMENWPEDSYGLYYNINFPSCRVDEVKGIRVTRMGHGHWIKEFNIWDEETEARFAARAEAFALPADFDFPLEEGEKAYYIVGEFVDDESAGEDADHRLLDDGWITITPMTADSTNYPEIEHLKQLGFNKDFKK